MKGADEGMYIVINNFLAAFICFFIIVDGSPTENLPIYILTTAGV